MMNTDVVKLGEITSITKLAGFEFTKYFNYNQTGEIIALRALNLRNGKLDLTDIHRIDKSISDKLPRSKLYKGDILFTYTGNGYGDCALVDEDDKYHLAPNICKITSNQEKVDYTFLFYTIRSKSFYGQVSGFIGGSGQPTIPMERIRKLKIFLPKMQVQQKIANILSRYDEAIENNNKRIKLLEQMAQNLYKEWFVRFRFPGYENCEFENGIPVGWKVEKLQSCCEIKIGGDVPSNNTEIKDGKNKIPIYSNGITNDGLYGFTNTFKIKEPSVTISARGTVGFVCLRREPYYPIVRLLCLIPKKEIDVYYFYQSLKYVDLNGNGTSQQQLTAPMVAKRKILIADRTVVKKYNSISRSIYAEIDMLKNKNQNLAKQRDLLLPRLMSGKLEVN